MFGFKKRIRSADLLLAELDEWKKVLVLLDERKPLMKALLRVATRMDIAKTPPLERVIGLRAANQSRWLEYLDLLAQSKRLPLEKQTPNPSLMLMGLNFQPLA